MIRNFWLRNARKFDELGRFQSITNMSTEVVKQNSIGRIKADLRAIFKSGIESVLPQNLVDKKLKLDGDILYVGEEKVILKKNVYLVGFGKAVMNMVPRVEKLVGSRLVKGIISVPTGSRDRSWNVEDFENFPRLSGPVEYREGAANNQPDEESVRTTNDIIDLVEGLTENDTLIVLISGGASALLCMPRPTIELDEKQKLCKKLQDAGADIVELNTVRKKLSMVKGGGLARFAYPATVVSLILSDIIGDPIDVIASGPTVYSSRSPDEVTRILDKYNLFDSLEWNIKSIITSTDAVEDEALLDEADQFKHVRNVVIGNNSIAIEAVESEALKKGYNPIVLRNDIRGNVSDISVAYANLTSLVCLAWEKNLQRREFFEIIKADPIVALSKAKIDEIYDAIDTLSGLGIVLIAGGEPTVVVTGNGRGGRNQQLALHYSLDWLTKITENPRLAHYDVVALSAGTDGQDGPTDAAGAFGYSSIGPTIYNLRNTLQISLNEARDDERTLVESQMREVEKLLPDNVINNNDTYNFYSRFKMGEDLLKTGLTGTNVMDLHIICIEKRECDCRVDFDTPERVRNPVENHDLSTKFSNDAKENDERPREMTNENAEYVNVKISDNETTKYCCSKRNR